MLLKNFVQLRYNNLQHFGPGEQNGSGKQIDLENFSEKICGVGSACSIACASDGS
jgi:hypothetical protein